MKLQLGLDFLDSKIENINELPLEITEQYATLCPMMDGSDAPIEERNVPTPNKPPINIDEISRQLKYRLKSGIRLRRESFGSIIQNGIYGHFFNQIATSLLLATKKPISIDNLLHTKINKSNFVSLDHTKVKVFDFIKKCLELELLEICDYDQISQAQIYFENANNFSDIYLYNPISVEIELTNKCFRKCTYCAYESGPNPKIKSDTELSTSQWLKIIDEMAACGVMSLEFTGGDPLTRSDAFELIQYADRQGIALVVNSDLSILKEEHLEKFSQLKHLRKVQTSLDGSTPESCDLTRGQGGFSTLMKQMELLAKANIPFTVGTVIHKRNYNEVSAIAELVASYGAKGFYIGPMYPAGRGVDLTDLIVSKNEWDVAVTQYMAAIKEGIIRPCDVLWYKLVEFLPGENPVRDQMFISPRGTRTLRIDPLGNFYVSAKLRQWHPRFWSLGNIQQFSLETVWNKSVLLNELRSYTIKPNPFDGIDVREISC